MKAKRIMIVDDVKVNIYLLRVLLEGNGYQVAAAENGAEALELARKNPPDLIISDILMPVMDGFALCREWKKDPRLKSVPFVLYTATYTDDRDRKFALSLGADQFIVKPQDPDVFMAIIKKAIRQVGNSPAAQRKSSSSSTGLPPAKAPEEKAEAGYLKQYNEALIRKLEAKMEQLARTNRELEQDIAARKKAEAERERLREQLNQAQKMESIGRLAGGIAHDFNNMLQTILGYAELAMAKLRPDQPLYEELKEIYDTATRSTSFARQLLAFARKQKIAPRVLNLNEAVEGMLKMLKRLIGEHIDMVWRPEADPWPVKIDPSQIDQILVNLCINARDALGKVGKINIATDNVVLDRAYCAEQIGVVPGEYVALTVSDKGCGMDQDLIKKIFEPFFTTKPEGSGTGLGLAIVYGIVKQNNGHIEVDSTPGKGTTFRICLPRHLQKK